MQQLQEGQKSNASEQKVNPSHVLSPAGSAPLAFCCSTFSFINTAAPPLATGYTLIQALQPGICLKHLN